MIIKSFILEGKIQLAENYKVILFYGENEGLKRDFKLKLKYYFKKKDALNFSQDDILKNDELIINEVKNKSLFEEKKIIFVSQINDKLLETCETILEDVTDEKIFVFADILDKKSKLRNYFEKSKSCGIVPCYKDNDITIRKLIIDRLKGFQGLSTEVVNLIIRNTNLDRNKVYNEIGKIISYFQGKKIDISKLDKLMNNESNDDFNLLRDAALNGDRKKTNKLLADTIFEADNNVYYINIINQRINKLKKISEMDKKIIDIETAIASLKPPIFWKDKPTMIEQARKWDTRKLNIALKKTFSVETEIKSSSSAKKNLLVKNLLVELCTSVNAS